MKSVKIRHNHTTRNNVCHTKNADRTKYYRILLRMAITNKFPVTAAYSQHRVNCPSKRHRKTCRTQAVRSSTLENSEWVRRFLAAHQNKGHLVPLFRKQLFTQNQGWIFTACWQSLLTTGNLEQSSYEKVAATVNRSIFAAVPVAACSVWTTQSEIALVQHHLTSKCLTFWHCLQLRKYRQM